MLEKQLYVRACVVGELPSGQKLIQIQATNADGLRFYTEDNSLVTADDIMRKAGAVAVPERAGCEYCQEDRDGYTRHLPRKGIGQASIHRHHPMFGGWVLHFSGKDHARAEIEIAFCPMCGRKLPQPSDKEVQL